MMRRRVGNAKQESDKVQREEEDKHAADTTTQHPPNVIQTPTSIDDNEDNRNDLQAMHKMLYVPPNMILPNLFLGSYHSTQNKDHLKSLEIKYILNLCPSKNLFPDDFVYLHCAIRDSSDEDVLSLFPKLFSFIEQGSEGESCLVVCSAGVSRSPTVLLAFLMSKGMTLKEAYELVRSKRKQIAPNPGFWRQLLKYEISIFGEQTLNLEEVRTSSKKSD
eukprot:TRINITY_DN2558_c0_g1_i3.p1 TRINITY_DN2558_c0_g1~~TRINITY_DN2558_c0_g1_i3.p1  ORF type:complete len:219 (+),score=37.77 TRINITY_DN2558_c0_g1_i3:161-817(+)